MNIFYLLSHGTDQLLILQPAVASILLELLFQCLELAGHRSLHLHRLRTQAREDTNVTDHSCTQLTFRHVDVILESWSGTIENKITH